MSTGGIQSSPAVSEAHVGRLPPGAAPTRKKSPSWLGMTLILVSIGSVSLPLAAIHRFGSLPSAVGYLRGERLIPDAYTKSFGRVSKSNEPIVDFSLNNFTSEPVRILGGNSSCTCLLATDLPVDVPPGGRATLRVRARSKSRSGTYSERLRLVTDLGESNVSLIVRGFFE
jgi:hypothetical protein